MTDYYDMAIRHPRKTAALIGKLKKDRIERQEYADKAEAKIAELTTWWKFEEACKNRACSKELEYIERIAELEEALKTIGNHAHQGTLRKDVVTDIVAKALEGNTDG